MIFEMVSLSRHKALCNDPNPSHRRGATELFGRTFKKNDLSLVEPTFFQAVYGRMNQGPH